MRKISLPFFLLTLMLACSATDQSKETSGTTDPTPKTIPIAKAGWDIYTGGTYRYGPSIIINADGSIDAWFAAPGGFHGEYISFFDESASNTPLSLGGQNTAAQRFSTEHPFYALCVNCPNWGSPDQNLTLSLYLWKENYSTTVATAPLTTQRFENYADNAWLKVTLDAKFSAGEYLWVLNGGSSPESGVWKQGGELAGVTNYLNGTTVSGCYKARLLLNPSNGNLYWDQVSYQRSTDGGRTWSKEKNVLKPTEGGRDELSICDPGVAQWGGYYYIGYTSTEDNGGVDNQVYVCRGSSPEGPWEKWNGSGWGGNPQPIIEYTGDPTTFGAGEPCMIILDGTLFFYYTWNDTGEQSTTTRLATAPADDPNWPAKLTERGVVINKSDQSAADHCDVKYRDDLKKFQAIHTGRRMTAQSYVMLWESTDGIHFTQTGKITGSLQSYLHNCGWSGDAQGHINPLKQTHYLSYAYGSATAPWGVWRTWWSPLEF